MLFFQRLNPFNHRGNSHLIPVTELTSLAPDDVTLMQEEPDKRFYIGMDFYYIDNPRFHHPRFYPTAGSKILQDSPQMNHISLILPPSPPLSQPGDIPEVYRSYFSFMIRPREGRGGYPHLKGCRVFVWKDVCLNRALFSRV